jgi:single-strand DNA-binding protein
MNSCTFVGRVGGDAELNYTKDGKAVSNFNIAIDNGKNKDTGVKRPATWIKCVLWEKRAESLSEYIKKGIVVAVQGPVTSEAWVSKKSGDAESRVVVTVKEFTFGGSQNSGDDSGPAAPRQAAAPVTPPSQVITDEDIPF